MPKPLKRAIAVVSLLLLAMVVPYVNTLAETLLLVPGGIVARAIFPPSPEGRTLFGGIAFFVVMIGIDVAVYYFVFSAFDRMFSRHEDDDEPQIDR